MAVLGETVDEAVPGQTVNRMKNKDRNAEDQVMDWISDAIGQVCGEIQKENKDKGCLFSLHIMTPTARTTTLVTALNAVDFRLVRSLVFVPSAAQLLKVMASAA